MGIFHVFKALNILGSCTIHHIVKLDQCFEDLNHVFATIFPNKLYCAVLSEGGALDYTVEPILGCLNVAEVVVGSQVITFNRISKWTYSGRGRSGLVEPWAGHCAWILPACGI